VSAVTSREVRAISVVVIRVERSSRSARVASAMTTSSIEQFPARSPMPLTATSTWRAPARTASSEFATASPRSLWQCTLTETSGPTRRTISAINAPKSCGNAYPTVSGMLTVVAPASTATSTTFSRKSCSVRVAS
jgi:transposase-like protein